jgi:predicted porin
LIFLTLGVFMKKSLVALAVLAASGASFAQSSVTLYGVVDASLARVTQTNQPSQTYMLSGAVATSVWGLKGSEDLGGGLKANFKLEQSFNVDTGAAGGSGFNREAWVGFSGGFGEVKLGKVSSAYNDSEGAAGAVFGSGAVGPIGVVFESDIQENSRPVNTIYYATPTFSGFNASVSYSLDEKSVTGTEVKSFGVAYAGGPLFASLGYQTQKAFGATTEVQLTQLNATYDLGVAKLLGALGNVSNSNAVNGDKAKEWQIGVDVPLSTALTLSVGYADSKHTFASGAADDKHTAFSIGGAYSLSKRTTAYVAAETDKFDYGNAAATDVTTNRYAVGVIHKF